MIVMIIYKCDAVVQFLATKKHRITTVKFGSRLESLFWILLWTRLKLLNIHLIHSNFAQTLFNDTGSSVKSFIYPNLRLIMIYIFNAELWNGPLCCVSHDHKLPNLHMFYQWTKCLWKYSQIQSLGLPFIPVLGDCSL